MAELRLAALWLGLACAAPGMAQEHEPSPDAEFLEYLGLWEETDEEWLLHDELVAADEESRHDPAPEGEASVEKDDEG